MSQYPQVQILNDQRIDLGNGVEIIGIDYRNSFDQNVYNQKISQLQASESRFSIFLYHEPNRVEQTAELGDYNLQLYGHTHN